MRIRFEAVENGRRVVYPTTHQPSVLPGVGDTVQIEYEEGEPNIYDPVTTRLFRRTEIVQLVVRQRLLDVREDTWTLLCCTVKEFEKEKAEVVAGEAGE